LKLIASFKYMPHQTKKAPQCGALTVVSLVFIY
jgi:hypothetical protein